MAQHDYSIANQSGASFRSDLNNALSAIVSQNSGTAEPSTTYAYQMWADTTNGVMKLRNAANNAWITLYQLDGEWSVIPFENGSAAAPSIYFKDSGTDTGFFSAGTDQVNVTTGGTERVEWGTSEVVFNDSGANYDFRVEGDTNANLLFVDASADAVGIGSSTPGSYTFNQLVVGSSGDQGVTIASGTTNTGSLAFADGTVGSSAYSGLVQYSHTDDYMRFFTAGSERMRLDSSGRLGIGTTPTSIFHVKAATNRNFKIDSAGGGGGDLRISALNDADSANVNLQLQGDQLFFAAGGAERARIDSSGRLLVGTSSTANENAQLQIQSSGAYGAQFFYSAANSAGSYLALSKSRGTAGSPSGISSGDGQGAIVFKGYAGSGWVDGAYIEAITDGTPGTNDLPTRLVFSTTADGASSPTERMRIDNAGSVDFGGAWSSSLRRKRITPDVIQSAWDSTNSRTHVEFYNPNGLVGSISTSASATAYNTSSDYRLKENINAIGDGIFRLLQLKPCRFNFKVDANHAVDGFIAHEVQTIVPEAITGEKDAVDDEGNPIYQGIDQSKLVPLLTAALQEAIGEIESLKARVTALESA